MSKLVRGAVSKKKRRYQLNGFDLDLSCLVSFLSCFSLVVDCFITRMYTTPTK